MGNVLNCSKPKIENKEKTNKTTENKKSRKSTSEDIDKPKNESILNKCQSDILLNLGSISTRERCKIISFLKLMDSKKLLYLTHHGILLNINKTKKWPIYFQFKNWKGPVTANAIDNILKNIQSSLDIWLEKLKGYNGFTTEYIKVKIFGFVFSSKVTTDSTFENKYGGYPIVKKWDRDDESCPWVISYDEKEYTNISFYKPSLDFSKIKVVRNKSNTGAFFKPSDFDNYKHPENLEGFYTKLWLGNEWVAQAQRQYLRISGLITDTQKGTFGDNYHVLIHEMGHCFFLDDLYDAHKYPPKYEGKCVYSSGKCTYNLYNNDSIMFGSKKLKLLDYIMLRHVWIKQNQFIQKNKKN
tara:strand:+ start:1387 stop:2451 length:1065 start_codon:yes stop_codon:yes gene_type:complete